MNITAPTKPTSKHKCFATYNLFSVIPFKDW